MGKKVFGRLGALVFWRSLDVKGLPSDGRKFGMIVLSIKICYKIKRVTATPSFLPAVVFGRGHPVVESP